MGRTIQLTCGHCGKRVIIPDGELGAVYTCPFCQGQNRAAREAVSTSVPDQQLSGWGRRVLGAVAPFAVIFVLVVIVTFAGLWIRDRGRTADPQSVNAVAFGLIAEAHGEDFRLLASKTESALADVEDLVSRTDGADLDPSIRDFAKMQADYARSMAGVVATGREAFEYPDRVPLDLWQRQLEYHQAARRLAAKYLPNWVEGLDMRIEHDEKMIRKLGG